jgi:hypothetical protein
MNVKGGCGIQFIRLIQGSPAFLNRSIYHARKSLTRLNIRISDICWMHFVQISLSPSLLGVYRLWKFENLGRFLLARRLLRLSSISRARERQKFSLIRLDFSRPRQNRPIWPIYIRHAAMSDRWHSLVIFGLYHLDRGDLVSIAIDVRRDAFLCVPDSLRRVVPGDHKEHFKTAGPADASQIFW